MANIHDLATDILNRQSHMRTIELRNLIYRAQSCSLRGNEEPLFLECIERGAIGPIVPDLCARNHPMRMVDTRQDSKIEVRTEKQLEKFDARLQFPRNKTSRRLSVLTRQVGGSRGARDSAQARVISGQEITRAAIAYRRWSLLGTRDRTGHRSNAVGDLPLRRLCSNRSPSRPELQPLSARTARTSS
jgi:hypothetical protein